MLSVWWISDSFIENNSVNGNGVDIQVFMKLQPRVFPVLMVLGSVAE